MPKKQFWSICWGLTLMTDSTLHIRQAVAEDAPELYNLIQHAMAVYAQNSNIKGQLDSQKESLEELQKHIAQEYVLVALQNDHPVGTVRLVRIDAATAYFSRFAVLPHFRKTGVGHKLYQEAEKWLLDQGYHKVVLHTALSNRDLVSFYEARGFYLQQTSFDRGYPRGKFCKNLAGPDLKKREAAK